MNISSLDISPALTPVEDGKQSQQSKVATAATSFEALLIGEMLKSVREASDDGWLGGGSDSSAESAYGVAENQLAQTIAAHGGFGLAKVIQKQFEKVEAKPSTGVQLPPAKH